MAFHETEEFIIMLTKRICFLHPGINSVEEACRALHIDVLRLNYELIWDEKKPEIVFASEHIYLNKDYYKEFISYLEDDKVLLVYYAGEAISPDMNLFDYAIVFDRKLHHTDRISRIPPMYFFGSAFNSSILSDDILDAKERMKQLRFCNFIYSNSNAHEMRDKLFYAINKYKNVDSLGHHLKNTEIESVINIASDNIFEEGIYLKNKYKFSIACENASFEGYTSEKLLTSYAAHSVPIYWGNPYVTEEFNPKAFINCNDFNNLDEVVQRVKEIDQNDQLWIEMVNEPLQTEEQHFQTEVEMANYRNFIVDIINAPHKLRRPLGMYPNVYRKWFKDESNLMMNQHTYIPLPLAKNNKSRNVLIYGAGVWGNGTRKIIEQLPEYKFSGFVDKYKAGQKRNGEIIYDICQVKELVYDEIWIAVKEHQSKIVEELLNMGVQDEKIKLIRDIGA